MKLGAIYNVWDGEEHLEQSMRYLRNHVDLFIIIYQTVSNFGEKHDPFNPWPSYFDKMGRVIVQHYNPKITDSGNDGTTNELSKRQLGLDIARHNHCTHFLHVDTDEYYPDFKELKQEYIDSGCTGSVCPIETYIAKKEYKITPAMPYFVPFIHELGKRVSMGYVRYPFRVDVTRKCQTQTVKELSYPMHHMSWVRDNIDRKVRNSSARDRRPTIDRIMDDYKYLQEGDAESYRLSGFSGRGVSIRQWI